jgi:hypothetical protein
MKESSSSQMNTGHTSPHASGACQFSRCRNEEKKTGLQDAKGLRKNG